MGSFCLSVSCILQDYFLSCFLYTVLFRQDVQSWYLHSLYPAAYRFHLNGLIAYSLSGAYMIVKGKFNFFPVFLWLLCHLHSLCFLFFPSVIAEENGHANTSQKGLLTEDASVASGTLEAVSKSTLSPQVGQVSEEQNMVPTPVKKSSKTKPQIDVKAELEKRQGGKQLLNLVVIGNTVKLHF